MVKLTRAGIDLDGLLHRLLGNASLLRIFIKKFVEDTTFETLQEAFAARDMQRAERASHTLKGMCGNLSLADLYEIFTEQTSFLRDGEYARAEAMMESLTKKYNNARSYMSSWLNET